MLMLWVVNEMSVGGVYLSATFMQSVLWFDKRK